MASAAVGGKEVDMTFESIIRSSQVREVVRSGPLGPYIDGFVEDVAADGYTPSSFTDLVRGVSQFARYLTRMGISDVKRINDDQVQKFIATLPISTCRKKYSMPSVRGSRAARRMIAYLRRIGVAAPEHRPHLPYAWILDAWLAFLRQHRGLSIGSVDVYRRNAEAFLEDLGPDTEPGCFASLTTTRVNDFLQRRAPRFSRATRKNLVVTLRSFLRFAFTMGHIPRDLAATIQRVPCFTLDRLPRGPKWEDLPKLLDTVDRSTNPGRRDYTILILLMTYGMRAAQVAGLRLQDIGWRDGEITFPVAKGGRQVTAPLTTSVGEALLAYLRDSRPESSARQIFLSLNAPFQPLTAGSIYNIVSRAFQHAGISSPHQGSHAIRHAWATRAFAQGQRLKTVADLLGHRSIESTRIYAKIDYSQLRSVGLPWPEEARS
jgi:integrase/recombinase XerD